MSASPSVADLLRSYPIARSIPPDAARGAVLAVVRGAPAGVEVLLIERTHRAGDPASGQVALPGGTVDPSDPSLESTAVRECEEEVGIGSSDLAEPPRFVRIGWVFVEQVPIAIFVAPLRDGGRPPRCASPEEVASVFWFPLRGALAAQTVRVETTAGPREVDATVFDGHVLWGFTRKALLDLAATAAPPGLPEAPAAPAIPPSSRGTSRGPP